MSAARTNVQHLLQSEKEVCCLCRRREGNKELVTQREFVVYCCLPILGPSCVFMGPLVLIWRWSGGDISVRFGWSFLGEWWGRGTILITLYLSWGLARGCRGSSGSGQVSVKQEGTGRVWAICSPCALQAPLLGSRFPQWSCAVEITATCLSVKRFPYPEGALKELPLSAWHFLTGGLCCHSS